MPDSSDDRRLRDYWQVVWRRRWALVLFAALVPAAAIIGSASQQRKYAASASVLLSRQDLANQLTGAQNQAQVFNDDRFVQTQADVARSPYVARQVLSATGLNKRSVANFLAASS